MDILLATGLYLTESICFLKNRGLQDASAHRWPEKAWASSPQASQQSRSWAQAVGTWEGSSSFWTSYRISKTSPCRHQMIIVSRQWKRLCIIRECLLGGILSRVGCVMPQKGRQLATVKMEGANFNVKQRPKKHFMAGLSRGTFQWDRAQMRASLGTKLFSSIYDSTEVTYLSSFNLVPQNALFQHFCLPRMGCKHNHSLRIKGKKSSMFGSFSLYRQKNRGTHKLKLYVTDLRVNQ